MGDGRPRITGGRLKGRPLPVAVVAGVRPTSSRVREALFSIVGQDLAGQRVLDAFGGSGLLAFEAVSRGADVVVVERNPKAAAAIRAAATELQCPVEVVVGDTLARVAGLGRFDGALLDPPYADPVALALEAVGPAVDGWLALEQDARAAVPASAGGLPLDRSRVYGGTALHVYRGRA